MIILDELRSYFDGVFTRSVSTMCLFLTRFFQVLRALLERRASTAGYLCIIFGKVGLNLAIIIGFFRRKRFLFFIRYFREFVLFKSALMDWVFRNHIRRRWDVIFITFKELFWFVGFLAFIKVFMDLVFEGIDVIKSGVPSFFGWLSKLLLHLLDRAFNSLWLIRHNFLLINRILRRRLLELFGLSRLFFFNLLRPRLALS